ncbi:uncharacterized protein LOC18435478 [Amborella trichopoda]|uniref:uncharacterized protein LOC18435478 n=1 Tax=Amborella trichopoda TaxID=13333 RepID=UPI0005D38DB3|nr:uncharacterized protein LOC18435478 [Amborella trichopoda]|eukprot:XP_006845586.2 uncharacterized protein LOC18435478 [Amborella trichopoda]
MAVEYPSALIQKIKTHLRNGAGLSSYDPSASDISSFASLDRTISSFNPSPAYLRCIKCQGWLPRGLRAHNCMFCGAQQRRPGLDSTIRFGSTHSYRRFLDSFGLNRSEAVPLVIEAHDPQEGQSASKEDLVRFDLSDLQLKWPEETEDIENSSTKNIAPPVLNTKPLNLEGVDLDNFFSGPQTQPGPSKADDQQVSNGQVSDAKSHLPSQTSVGVVENRIGSSHTENPGLTNAVERENPSSSWEADFKPVGSESLNIETSQVDPFFASTSITQNLMTSAQTNDGIIEPQRDSFHAKNPELANEGEDRENPSFSWEAEFQSATVEPLNIEGTPVDPFSAFTNLSKTEALIGDSNPGVDAGNPVEPFSASTNLSQTEVLNSDSNQGVDPFSASTNISQTELLINDSNQRMDTFSGLTNIVQTEVQTRDSNQVFSLEKSWVESDLWRSASVEVSKEVKPVTENDDSFDDWQDFTGSVSAPDPLSAWQKTSGSKYREDSKSMNFDGFTNDSQETQIDNSVGLDIFPGVSSTPNGNIDARSAEIEASTIDRFNFEGFESISGVETRSESNKNSFAANKSENANYMVQTLLSEMPDLSFMLEDKLSIPKKTDASG